MCDTVVKWVWQKNLYFLSGGMEDNLLLDQVQDRYSLALQDFIQNYFPSETNRYASLLLWLPQIQTASALLLKSKMIYIPFFLNA